MKKLVLSVMLVLSVGVQAYAGNGDLIVDGNVGIGMTNPAQGNLVIGQDDGLGDSGGIGLANRLVLAPPHHSGSDWYFTTRDNSPSSGYAYLDIGYGTSALSIRHDGNVGIGKTDPAQRLDVQGQVASNGVILTSDAKFKKNLLPIKAPLDKVLNLTGLTYEWKTVEYKEKNFQSGRHYGVIAQEIEKILPEVVNTAPDGSKAVAYTEIIPVLIEAIKEQQKQIDELKKKLADIGK